MPRSGRTFVGVYGPVDPSEQERRDREGGGIYDCVLEPPSSESYLDHIRNIIALQERILGIDITAGGNEPPTVRDVIRESESFIGLRQPLNIRSIADLAAEIGRRLASNPIDEYLFSHPAPSPGRILRAMNSRQSGLAMVAEYTAMEQRLREEIEGRHVFSSSKGKYWTDRTPVVAAVDWSPPPIKPPPWVDPTEGLGPPRQPAISFA